MAYEIYPISKKDVEKAYQLEKIGYPKEEAASRQMLVYRQDEAPELFLGCFIRSTLIGFICATRYHGTSLTGESMNMHIPNGGSVCIHSLCVAPDMRRKGVGTVLLTAFLEAVKDTQIGVDRIVLICHSNLIPLYTRVGFTLVGKSPVTHGKGKWWECELILRGNKR
ncbi:unnamed protein product [Owenia fusiformis]|uniref:Serotonin N-acetyltransferase n=1 Tax=Owenia fusiformis TaxID=6347 RepID=A0A8J1U7L0_OWEFU|nr:unnamed protein product [Owenia fusiformis]